jgi:hypothetical protein
VTGTLHAVLLEAIGAAAPGRLELQSFFPVG